MSSINSLRELGYTVAIAATLETAEQRFRGLYGDLAAIVCDNKLLRGEPIGARFYANHRPLAPTVLTLRGVLRLPAPGPSQGRPFLARGSQKAIHSGRRHQAPPPF